MKKIRSIPALILALTFIVSCMSISFALSLDEEIAVPYEKMSAELVEQYELLAKDETVPTVIWLSDIDLSAAESTALKTIGMTADEWKTHNTTVSALRSADRFTVSTEERNLAQTYIEAKRAAAVSLYTKHNQNLINKLLNGVEVTFVSRYSPVVIANLSKDMATSLSASADVCSLGYIEPSTSMLAAVSTSSNQISLSLANTITRASTVHSSSAYGFTGAGIKIGVFEMGVPSSSEFSDATVVWEQTDAYNDAYVWHANNVMDIITSIAPEADYYIATTYYTIDDFAAIEALLDNGVNIISASRTVGNDGNNTYGDSARWLDHIAYQHDVHFVQAAGNSGGSSISNSSTGICWGATAYNIVTVGNLYVNGTTSYSDDEIWTGAQPSSYYTGSALANKPDICAPGEGVVTSYGTFGGTSGATPHVAGTIALLCEQRPSLKYEQNAVKAILAASINFTSEHGYVPGTSGYQKYGAGLLDCIGACFVTGNYRYVSSTFPSSSSVKSHSFTVTNSDTRIRVALAFNIRSVASGTDHESAVGGSITNLNIQVKDPHGNIVGSSITSNNNIEIVDFIPTTTGTYTVTITRADTSSETVYYGLAWR